LYQFYTNKTTEKHIHNKKIVFVPHLFNHKKKEQQKVATLSCKLKNESVSTTSYFTRNKIFFLSHRDAKKKKQVLADVQGFYEKKKVKEKKYNILFLVQRLYHVKLNTLIPDFGGIFFSIQGFKEFVCKNKKNNKNK